MKDAPAFDFYPSDWLSGTLMMSHEEKGLYVDLLAMQWEDGCLPPEEKLKRIRVKPSVLTAVLEKFPVGEDGKRRNARLERERMKQRDRRERKAEGARKTNAKRWHSESLSDRLATPERPFSDPFSESPPITNHQSPQSVPLALPNSVTTSEPTRTAERPRVEVEDWSPNPNAAEAESIVGLYPANGNRYEAQRAVLEAIKAGESPQAIRSKVAAHAARYRVLSPRDRQFCPALQTYFSEARWRDDPDSAPWTRHAPITRQQEIESAQKSHIPTEALF